MSAFLKDGATIAAGNLLAQGISIGLIPIVTRVFTPEEYGNFASVMAVLVLLVPLATLRFDVLQFVPLSPLRRRQLYQVGCIIALSVSSLVGLVLLMVLLATSLFEVDRRFLRPWLLVPPLLLLNAFYRMEMGRVLRERAFSRIAVSRVLETAADRISSIGLGLSGGGVSSLLFARGFGLALAWQICRRYELFVSKRAISWVHIRVSFRRHFRVGLNASVAGVVDSAGRYSPQLLLPVLYSPDIAGLFALAMMLIGMPMTLIGDALAGVFAQRCAENIKNLRALNELIREMNAALFVMIWSVPILLMLIGADLFAFAFGEPWRAAGPISVWMAVSLHGAFTHRVIGVLFELTGLSAIRLKFDLCNTICRFIALVSAGMLSQSYLVAIAAYALISGLFYLSATLWLLRKLNLPYMRRRDASLVVVFSAGFLLAAGAALSMDALSDRVLVTVLFGGMVLTLASWRFPILKQLLRIGA